MTSGSGGLKRELGLLDLTMSSLGAILGSGWLFGALVAANLAGPAAIYSWIIGGIAVMLIGLVYAELGGMLPQAGGVVRYPQYSHGTLVSFLMGWAAWIGYCTVPPIEAEAVTQYANHWLHGLFAKGSLTPTGILVSALLMVVFFLVNFYGVRLFATVNTKITILKFLVPSLTLIVLFAVGIHASNFSSHGFAPSGSSGVLTAIATGGVVFAYLGFRQAVDMAGEAKNPQRDVPRAVIIAIIIGIVLYVLLQVAFVGAVQPAALAHGWAKLSFSAPFADVAGALGLGWLASLLLADAVLSPGGTGIVYTASTPRVSLALTKNGYWPSSFAILNARGVPYVGLITSTVIGLLLLLPFPGWSKLVGIVSAAIVFTYIVGPVAALVLRRTAPQARRPLHLAGMSIIAPVAFVIASLIIYWAGWPITGDVLIAMAVGLPLYYYFHVKNKLEASHAKAGIWLIAFLIFMIVVSYLGSFGGIKLLPYPWDMVVVAVGSLIAFYAGVASGITTEEVKNIGDEQALLLSQASGN